MAHTKEINKNNRTGTYKVTHRVGLLHSCTLVIILNLGLPAVHDVHSDKSSALVNKRNSEKIAIGAHNVIYHHSIFYFWQNKKLKNY